MRIEPKSRPELRRLTASIGLPKYLERDEPVSKEVRGSTVSVVKGSSAMLTAIASRELQHAAVNGIDQTPIGNQFSSDSIIVDQPTSIELSWRDSNGLTGKDAFALVFEPVER